MADLGISTSLTPAQLSQEQRTSAANDKHHHAPVTAGSSFAETSTGVGAVGARAPEVDLLGLMGGDDGGSSGGAGGASGAGEWEFQRGTQYILVGFPWFLGS